jgi:hypothetical protein
MVGTCSGSYAHDDEDEDDSDMFLLPSQSLYELLFGREN